MFVDSATWHQAIQHQSNNLMGFTERRSRSYHIAPGRTLSAGTWSEDLGRNLMFTTFYLAEDYALEFERAAPDHHLVVRSGVQ